jgi:hypothetical protein
MIKRLKSSDKTIRPFTTFKSWKHSTVDNLDSIVLEQPLYDLKTPDGDIIYSSKTCLQISDILKNEYGLESDVCKHPTIDLDSVKLEKKIHSNVNYENGIVVSPEEINTSDRIAFPIKKTNGKKTNGTFYPSDHPKFDKTHELLNWDGSYQRLVYNNIKHLFYNDYFVEHFDYTRNKKLNIKNPRMLFGVESAEYHDPTLLEDIDQGDSYTGRKLERRVIEDEITVVEISQKNFGDKIKPGSVQIRDNSSMYDTIEVVDDGYTNLVTNTFTFSDINTIEFDDTVCGLHESHQSNSFSFGKTTSAYKDYLLVGAPVNVDIPDESQSGLVVLYKKDQATNNFRCIRSFMCPFTQNGLALEQRQDHNDLLFSELSGALLGKDYSLNDQFGNALELTETTCVIGSPQTHIRGTASESRTGHVFVYDKNKGGVDNWGLVNIIEGIPETEFGHSVSVHNEKMAIGAPGAMNGRGVVYIFEKKIRTEDSPWIRLTDVPEGYKFNKEQNKRIGYPSGEELVAVNKDTTRWKINSVIPPGSQLGCFHSPGSINIDSICDSGSYLSGEIITKKTDDIIKRYRRSGSWTSGSYVSGTYESGCVINPVIESGNFLSGCIESGNFLSGCIESGNFLSGNFLSGNFLSGCIESGTNLHPTTVDWKEFISGCMVEEILPGVEITSGSLEPIYYNNCISGSNEFVSGSICPCEVYTFSDEKIIVESSIVDEELDFDSGYEPHEYTNTPNFAIGDFTWELTDIIYGDQTQTNTTTPHPSTETPKLNAKCERFGEVVKLHENYLYVSTPSSEKQIVYVHRYTQGGCPTEWSVVNKITREYLWSAEGGEFSYFGTDSRNASVLYPYIYEKPKDASGHTVHNFGISLDVNDRFLVIGDSRDRVYKNNLIENEGGVVFVFSSNENLHFKYKIFSQEDKEEPDTFRFGQSVSLYETSLVIGSPSIETSNITLDDAGNLHADDYFFGVSTSNQEFIEFGDTQLNTVQGKTYYFDLLDNKYESLKTVTSTKEKMSIRKQYGYSVSITSEFIYVGSPIIGTFPHYGLSTFDETVIGVGKSQALFSYYDKTLYSSDFSHTNLSGLVGLVTTYDSITITSKKQLQVGNIFYKNGIIVLSGIKSGYMKDFMQKSGHSGYEINFKGMHTLHETEILCKVEPNEFNMSTNPTSVVRDKVPYDINGDGKFDIFDLIFIFKFLTDTSPASIQTQVEFTDTELETGISVEQDTMWPNSDILLTESEDAILKFFVNESSNVNKDEYSLYLPYLRLLKERGHFDINNDGLSDRTDAKLILRYFRGNSGVDLVGGLLTPGSKRRVAVDIIKFLDERTGKFNGVEILKDFESFSDLRKLIKNGKNLDSLKPHATTIGLYDGLSLVGVAKLGRPVKITNSYPINFLVKYDG